ncbi:MAG: hypothetical protein M3Y04_09260 [Actinomycetota bacterium]|nr:hypothetical protein [Actinomycetota bacterium]
MRRVVGSLGLVAVLALTACGGSGDKKAAAPTTTVYVAAPTTTLLTGNDQAGTAFCQQTKNFQAKYNALLPSVNDPVKLKAASTDLDSSLSQAKSTAPPEIKGDVNVVATTASQVLAALQKTNFVFANSTDAVTKLQDPAFQTSLDRVLAYGQAHCGLS